MKARGHWCEVDRDVDQIYGTVQQQGVIDISCRIWSVDGEDVAPSVLLISQAGPEPPAVQDWTVSTHELRLTALSISESRVNNARAILLSAPAYQSNPNSPAPLTIVKRLGSCQQAELDLVPPLSLEQSWELHLLGTLGEVRDKAEVFDVRLLRRGISALELDTFVLFPSRFYRLHPELRWLELRNFRAGLKTFLKMGYPRHVNVRIPDWQASETALDVLYSLRRLTICYRQDEWSCELFRASLPGLSATTFTEAIVFGDHNNPKKRQGPSLLFHAIAKTRACELIFEDIPHELAKELELLPAVNVGETKTLTFRRCQLNFQTLLALRSKGWLLTLQGCFLDGHL